MWPACSIKSFWHLVTKTRAQEKVAWEYDPKHGTGQTLERPAVKMRVPRLGALVGIVRRSQAQSLRFPPPPSCLYQRPQPLQDVISDHNMSRHNVVDHKISGHHISGHHCATSQATTSQAITSTVDDINGTHPNFSASGNRTTARKVRYAGSCR